MENFAPKGLIVEELIDSSIKITTEKRELVFPDYFALFFVLFGFCMLSFSIIYTGLKEIPLFLYIAMSIMLGSILLNLLISIQEIFIIVLLYIMRIQKK